MFVKEISNKHIMDFNSFLDLVTSIAKIKYPSLSSHEALRVILEQHFFPLYENIMTDTNMG